MICLRSLKKCLSAWRLWSIRQAQELRRANRLASSLRMRSLLRSWRWTAGEAARAEQLRQLQKAQELVRHQERQKLRYVRGRMLHLRAACLCKIQTFRWTARVAKIALVQWRLASQVCGLARSVSRKWRQEILEKVMKCFKDIVNSRQSARFAAQRQHAKLLADVVLSWQHTVKLKVQRVQHFRSKADQLRNLRRLRQLKQDLITWHNQLQSIQKYRMQETRLISNRRRGLLSNAFTLLKDVRKLAQKTQDVMQRCKMSRIQRGLEALKMNADQLRRKRTVSSRHKCIVSRNKLRCWSLLYQAHGKVARLAERQQQFARRILMLWLHNCVMSDIFRTWQYAVKLSIKEVQAAEFHQVSLKGLAASALQGWLDIADTLKRQRQTSLQHFELLWLRRYMGAWQGHVVEARLIELHRMQQLINTVKRILWVWRQKCHVFRRLRVLHFRTSLKLCSGVFRLWHMIRRSQRLKDTVERDLKVWTLSSWAEWAALRRQVRDEVAWQRWADGIVDLFNTRRLLLGLPTCFASWSHFYRFRKARSILASNKQHQMNRQMAEAGFAALRRNLALSRFGQVDRTLAKAQRSITLQLLSDFRRICRISSQSETVVALQHRLCKERVSRPQDRLVLSTLRTKAARVSKPVIESYCFRPSESCIVCTRGGAPPD